jgi:hypothetical protein
MQHPRRQSSSYSPQWKPEISRHMFTHLASPVSVFFFWDLSWHNIVNTTSDYCWCFILRLQFLLKYIQQASFNIISYHWFCVKDF